MAVALGTGERQAHPHVHRRVDAVEDRVDPVFLVVVAGGGVGLRVAIEGGRDELPRAGPRQEVPRELLDGELIERQVGVERVDHPVAKQPNRSWRVAPVTLRVRISREVEPGPGPPLAESRVGQKLLDQPFIRIWIRVTEKIVDLRQVRRQPAQIQTQPPHERVRVGRRRKRQPRLLELRADKEVDWIADAVSPAHARQWRALELFERPVLVVPRPLFTHRVSNSICAGASDRLARPGGIRSSLSNVVMR